MFRQPLRKMTSKEKNTIISVLFALVLIFVFVIGYNSGKRQNAPVVVNDTIWNIDTIVHHVKDTFPWYVVKRDTVIFRDTVFKDVDTGAIVKDYLSIRYITQIWEDSLLFATNEIALTENNLLDSKFNYRIKRGSSVVYVTENKYSYSKYLYVGLQSDFKYGSISLFYGDRRALYGLGYNPFENRLSITGAVKIGQFK